MNLDADGGTSRSHDS